MSENISVEKIIEKHVSAVDEICYRTGFMGDDLTGTGRFNDRLLFNLLFSRYYSQFQRDHSFVALDNNSNVTGYILGMMDAKQYHGSFSKRIFPYILARMFFVTWWRHPESFCEMVSWQLRYRDPDLTTCMKEYPAHLHINIDPEHQGRGAGSVLLETFEHHCRSEGIPGIHLITSNHNTVAGAFYLKKGYRVLLEMDNSFWKGVHDYKTVVYGKKL